MTVQSRCVVLANSEGALAFGHCGSQNGQITFYPETPIGPVFAWMGGWPKVLPLFHFGIKNVGWTSGAPCGAEEAREVPSRDRRRQANGHLRCQVGRMLHESGKLHWTRLSGCLMSPPAPSSATELEVLPTPDGRRTATCHSSAPISWKRRPVREPSFRRRSLLTLPCM